jgi:hypothetical protein
MVSLTLPEKRKTIFSVSAVERERAREIDQNMEKRKEEELQAREAATLNNSPTPENI